MVLKRTYVSEERSVSIMRVTRIAELEMLAVASYQSTSVPIRATRRNIPGDGILHSHRSENLKSYKYDGDLKYLQTVKPTYLWRLSDFRSFLFGRPKLHVSAGILTTPFVFPVFSLCPSFQILGQDLKPLAFFNILFN
jgi:hypothetical protein